ncbi:MAG: hypothetical protein CGU29_15320 [Candidatus Dactylopiibacterium carminicum]|uniref:Uncharacterized protein n=1 Tax=Candidatus Dactylopiibacterium carminicum TaxID=857335 RepID=A0A272ENC8_9RHOO|nr:glycosyltransferase family 39 protein [Candidatus Dactylopiibacterium carminicum]KAF7598076.1 hypothetical protein BGI27_15345 [Candidatus Dactylopiibacterium carminicum]PAS91625.1 MAG: hypothetical protein CGU29_15320 [Candidatus Dactylopiibacterium carminicum]PAS96518.1 MAG: hypothetical protein BSR46_15390 [Candidatus Dactylopiibacterium carminicum]
MYSAEFPSSKPAIHVPNWALILLFIAYALPGNIGHAPWRGDDALHIGIAYGMLQDGQWLTPSLAGQPFYDWPPLTYWLGALSGLLFGWLLPLHDAIRLINVPVLALLIVTLRFTARSLYGRESASAAAMLALGSLGLLIHAHEMQPLLLLSACFSSTLYGLVVMRETPSRGAWITSLASAGSVLSGGLPGLFLSLPLWLAAWLCLDRRGMLRLVLPFLALLSLWPFLLAIFAPDYLGNWWSRELYGSAPHTGHLQRVNDFANLVGWFTWPLWPVAGWLLWRRRQRLHEFLYALPLAAAVLALLLALSTGSMRPANMLPLLPPLILLAAGELCQLRRGAANAFDWFGVSTFTLLGIGLWLAWTAMHFGWPVPLSRNVLRLVPGFDPQWSWQQLTLALVLSIGWLIAILRLPFFQLRGAVHWALGVTLIWGLATTLWLNWFDYDKNYQATALDLQRVLTQQQATCVENLGVGDSQRAALYYFIGLKLKPATSSSDRKACALGLMHASGDRVLSELLPGWDKIWEKRRGRGRFAERIALYQRNSNP